MKLPRFKFFVERSCKDSGHLGSGNITITIGVKIFKEILVKFVIKGFTTDFDKCFLHEIYHVLLSETRVPNVNAVFAPYSADFRLELWITKICGSFGLIERFKLPIQVLSANLWVAQDPLVHLNISSVDCLSITEFPVSMGLKTSHQSLHIDSFE